MPSWRRYAACRRSVRVSLLYVWNHLLINANAKLIFKCSPQECTYTTPRRNTMKKSFVLIAAAALLLSVTPKARAAATNEELQKQMDELKTQMKSLGTQSPVAAADPSGTGEAGGSGNYKP